MKKIQYILIALILTFTLAACNKKIEHADIFKYVEIEYQGEDTSSNITQNIVLPKGFSLFPNFEITWVSDNEEVIKVESQIGIVTRQNETVIVNLDAYLTINDVTKSKNFMVVVAPTENIIKPTITGPNDFYIIIGDAEPDYLSFVFAEDSQGNNLAVTILEYNVLYYELGVYQITFSATDSNGITETKTVNVYVVETEQMTINKIMQDRDDLVITTSYLNDGNIYLPTTGNNGSAITWSYEDEENPNNDLIDLEALTVTTSIGNVYKVKLVATLVYKNRNVTKTFELTIGEEPISIASALAKNDNQTVYVKGVVTTFYQNESGNHIFIQDDTKGTYLTITNSFVDQIEVGYEIVVKGSKKTNNGNKYIEATTLVLKQNQKTINATTAKANNLYNYNGSVVYVEGLLNQKYTTGSNFILKTKEGEINLTVPIGFTFNQMYNQDAGLLVNVTAVVWEGKLVLTNDADIEFETSLNGTYILDYLVNTLDFPEGTYSNKITLINNSDLPFGLTISWQSSHPSIVTNSGVVNNPDSQTVVTLTFTIKSNDTVLIIEDLDVTITSDGNYSGTYYNSINFNSSTLLLDLRGLISTSGTLRLKNYGDARDLLQVADKDPNNSSNVLLIYNRASVKAAWDEGKTWNREHVYPQSHMGTDVSNSTISVGTDLQNLRAANPNINTSRGNKFFADKVGGGVHGAVGSGYYPGDADRGDVARIILYMHVAWNLPINSKVGNLNTFLKWHFEDLPDSFEINRNEEIFKYQKNRNPFIDFPDLATTLFGEVQLSNGDVIFVEITISVTDLTPFKTRKDFSI